MVAELREFASLVERLLARQHTHRDIVEATQRIRHIDPEAVHHEGFRVVKIVWLCRLYQIGDAKEPASRGLVIWDDTTFQFDAELLTARRRPAR